MACYTRSGQQVTIRLAALNIVFLQLLFTIMVQPPVTVLGAARPILKKNMNIPAFEVFNVLSIQGASSTQGYNAVRCGGNTAMARQGPLQFGDVFCFDMPLLKAQDEKSELLGRVQGTFTMSQLTGGRLFVAETFIVNATSLPFKGSFSAVGIENVGQPSSKPITGGTGDFELVTGDAFTTPLGGSTTTDEFGNAVFWFLYEFVFN